MKFGPNVMNRTMDGCASLPRLCGDLRAAFTAHGQPQGRIVLAQAPGVVDVMGGICEDAGSLVLTATLGLSVQACIWETGGSEVRVRLHHDSTDGEAKEFALPVSAFGTGDPEGYGINDRCRSAQSEWAAPAFLVLHRALVEGTIPRPAAGLSILLESDFPVEADLGRPCATAAAVLDGLCKLHEKTVERFKKAELASAAVVPLTGLRRTRVAMTAFCGAPDGSLLRMQFRPNPLCEVLALPAGLILTAVRTHLTRPTTRERLLETRLCAEMGERMIHNLRRRDGHEPGMASLAAITPVDYVEHYRNDVPQKITAKAFAATFGEVRGLTDGTDGRAVYKVRSRLEHHIYENQRVQEFVTAISRARRTGAEEALIEAGEKMYASHWSHSQRCGIGGAEADLIKDEIRARGPKDGLYGAKVTGGGEGGEVVVLMRNDEKAKAALASAMKDAGAACKRAIDIYDGSLGGADFFKSPEMSQLLATA